MPAPISSSILPGVQYCGSAKSSNGISAANRCLSEELGNFEANFFTIMNRVHNSMSALWRCIIAACRLPYDFNIAKGQTIGFRRLNT